MSFIDTILPNIKKYIYITKEMALNLPKKGQNRYF